jgi:hypothetical protein
MPPHHRGAQLTRQPPGRYGGHATSRSRVDARPLLTRSRRLAWQWEALPLLHACAKASATGCLLPSMPLGTAASVGHAESAPACRPGPSISRAAHETTAADEFGARRQTIGSRSLLAVIARERTASSVTTAGRPTRKRVRPWGDARLSTESRGHSASRSRLPRRLEVVPAGKAQGQQGVEDCAVRRVNQRALCLRAGDGGRGAGGGGWVAVRARLDMPR